MLMLIFDVCTFVCMSLSRAASFLDGKCPQHLKHSASCDMKHQYTVHKSMISYLVCTKTSV